MTWWEKMLQAVLFAKDTEDLKKLLNENVVRNPNKRVTKSKRQRVKVKRGKEEKQKAKVWYVDSNLK